jgi:COP9 signalosome complex subunit 6
VKAQEGKAVPVYGALIGKQAGRDIELMNSFELDYNVIEGVVVIDRDYYNTKEEQFKQVPTENTICQILKIVFAGFLRHGLPGLVQHGRRPGATGHLGPQTDHRHQRVATLPADVPGPGEGWLQIGFVRYENGICVQAGAELPVSLYESVIDMVNLQARMLFVKLPYTLATEVRRKLDSSER